MLKKDTKNYYLLFMVCLLIACSNRNNNEDVTLRSNEFVNKNFAKYSSEYKIINDSIRMYTDSSLKTFLTEYYSDWQVDSFIAINSSKDKLVAVVNSSAGIFNHDVTDDATKMLGKKIDGKWFFFKGGGSLAILRSAYGKDGQHLLTFHELSQIARKEMLASALIKNAQGEYIVNDKWVDEHFYNVGYGKYNSKAKYDSVHWKIIIDKWKYRIDTNEYKPLHRNKINNPASPLVGICNPDQIAMDL